MSPKKDKLPDLPDVARAVGSAGTRTEHLAKVTLPAVGKLKERVFWTDPADAGSPEIAVTRALRGADLRARASQLGVEVDEYSPDLAALAGIGVEIEVSSRQIDNATGNIMEAGA